MAPTEHHHQWAWLTDLLALCGNIDDELIHVLRHNREQHIIEAMGRGRYELEKLRRELITARDERKNIKETK